MAVMDASFDFISNVPVEAQDYLRPLLQDWMQSDDYGVFGIEFSGVGNVDFCRKPWPPQAGIRSTVGAERDIDTMLIFKWLAQLSSQK